MNALFKLIAVSAFLLAPLHEATAADSGAELRIENAVAFATAKTQKNGAVFMSIKNPSKQSRKIVAASSDIAERIELHTHKMDGGIMQMRQVEQFEIPASRTHALAPSGDHIMVMGLTRQLKPTEHFDITLTFQNGETLSVPVTITPPGTLEIQNTEHTP